MKSHSLEIIAYNHSRDFQSINVGDIILYPKITNIETDNPVRLDGDPMKHNGIKQISYNSLAISPAYVTKKFGNGVHYITFRENDVIKHGDLCLEDGLDGVVILHIENKRNLKLYCDKDVSHSVKKLAGILNSFGGKQNDQ